MGPNSGHQHICRYTQKECLGAEGGVVNLEEIRGAI